MTQPGMSGGPIPPASFTEAQVLLVTPTQHLANVSAQAPIVRALGPSILAAVSPSDLIPPFLGVPTVLSPDARLARVMRGH